MPKTSTELLSHANGLRQDDSGVWIASDIPGISYPSEGNRICAAIEDGSFWFRHRNRCILAAMAQYPPPGVLLDVGGGNGFTVRAMNEGGYESALLEPGPDGIAYAYNTRGVRPVIHATLESARFEGESVPAIGLFDVMEHIKEEDRFLEEVYRVLVPGGRVYLTVPAYGFLWSQADDDALHRRRYSKERLRGTLAKRFDVICQTGFFRALLPAILLFRALPFCLGLSRRADESNALREHGCENAGPALRLMTALLERECDALKAGRQYTWGASLLAVAQRK